MDFNQYITQPQPYQFISEDQYAQPESASYDTLTQIAFHNPSDYQAFDQNGPFAESSIIPSQPSAITLQRPALSNTLPYDSSGSVNELAGDAEFDQAQRGSSDEEKEFLTPAQRRRKAQNRAAQRAFRERKERRVKDLEVKLKLMEAKSTDLVSDNERLKRELDRIATQNEILRATSQPLSSSKLPQVHVQRVDSDDPDAAPVAQATVTVESPRSFDVALSEDYVKDNGDGLRHSTTVLANGDRLLSTGAAWELVQNHPLFKQGSVDLGEVVDRLREKVECDGTGPAFPESAVQAAIRDSVGLGNDELI